ncbi:MAG: hypothetical protein WA484_09495 [Solirubrobacteraceae bacterium]
MTIALSKSIELFLARPVPDRTVLRFKANCSPKDAAERWQPIVESALSFSSQLIDATDLGLKNSDTVAAALEKFQGMIEATVDTNRERYAEFGKLVELSTDIAVT